MKQIFQDTVARVERGVRFSVNFKTRSLRVGRKYIIRNGKTETPLGLTGSDTEEAMQCIATYYRRYKHSVPSERSERRRRNYFRALPEERLTDRDMCFGMHRETARAALEVYTLCAIIGGWLRWPDASRFFYQSPDDSDLILLREWIEPNV